ncbi:hypothetical protein N7520_005974 [Penicillium odoratum]|uniref:uncharacterized protein n=1 Tax=Penicillium odoratum TaxID=1167516 RepID=UPI0025482D7E|nr:uncharacterized protein N7520_005974 [Penicillium odoratum]KAJ5758818.1 hypothetical protein N7520_005974 [Penicillium odoratum]
MAEGLTRYHSVPPSDAIIIHDMQSLRDLSKANPETCLHTENGGYYLKTQSQEVIAIAADDLCKELDIAAASAYAVHVAEGDGFEDGESVSSPVPDFTKRDDHASSSLPEGKCSHPRCFVTPTCLEYSFCHTCLIDARVKRCI